MSKPKARSERKAEGRAARRRRAEFTQGGERSPMTRLDVAGIGSMVVDRVHRAPRLVGADAKAILRDVDGAGPVRRFVGGVVLNHLGWAAALGLRTGIFGRQAEDENGRTLRDAMDRFGIERHLDLSGSASSLAEIFVDDAGARSIYMAPGATAETTAEHVRRDHAEFLRTAARITTEISQLPLDAVNEVLRIAKDAGIPSVLDLDVPPSDAVATLGDAAALESAIRAADLLKPSRSAVRELVPDAGDDPLAIARALRKRFGNRAVVVTAGAKGCAVAADDFEGAVAAKPVRAVDTTGAGDAFLGGLLVGLHHGLAWPDAAALANACGAACAAKLGAFPDDAAAAREGVLAFYGKPIDLGPLPSGAPASRTGADEAREVLRVAGDEIAALSRRLGAEPLARAIELVRRAGGAGGRVHVTGVGKPEHVAHYAASLLSSTGTPATFLHATETVHGSAGQVVKGDVVIAISNSGETVELRAAVEAVRRMGAAVIAVTGGLESWLARNADVTLDAGVAREGGALGLAPRASAAAELLVLAALAAGLERECGFSRADYHLRHPAGRLGDLSRDD